MGEEDVKKRERWLRENWVMIRELRSEERHERDVQREWSHWSDKCDRIKTPALTAVTE